MDIAQAETLLNLCREFVGQHRGVLQSAFAYIYPFDPTRCRTADGPDIDTVSIDVFYQPDNESMVLAESALAELYRRIESECDVATEWYDGEADWKPGVFIRLT